jgi:hypothetical protein
MHHRRKYGIKQAMESYPVIMNFLIYYTWMGDNKTAPTYLQRRKYLKK